MLQKLKDFMLMVKQDRRYQIFTALGTLLVVSLFTCQPNNPRLRSAKPKQEITTGVTAQSEIVPDLVRALKSDVDQLKNARSATDEKLVAQQKEMTEYVQRNAEIFRKLIDRVSESESAISNMNTGKIGANGAGGVSPEIYTGESSNGSVGAIGPDGMPVNGSGPGLDEFTSVSNPVVAPPVPQNNQQRVAVVGAGDSVRVKLLSGINAPTDGTPYPVVLKLTGDVHGPDGSVLPLGEARLVAAAQGSLTDSRALFRLTSLNIRYPDGRRNVIDVDGWVVGEDGLRGMEGVLIDPIGKAIAAGAIAGGLEGMGQAFAAKNTTVTSGGIANQRTSAVTGDELDFAKGMALQGAAQSWSRLIENRVNRLVPQVQVLSNREGTAVFAKSFKVPGLIEALDEGDDTYNSLD